MPERPAAVHLLQLFRTGTSDEDWLGKIKSKGWLPITADRGKSNRGPKLPRLCAELGIVHVTLSSNVQRLPVDERMIAIAACWLDIVDIWKNPRGCAHNLRFADAGGKRFKLVDVWKPKRPGAITRRAPNV
jgi:hypothetical protein